MLSGLPSWRWELALKYVDVLTHIAMHGSTSEIRRQALMGNHNETDYIHHLASIVRTPLLSAGLFDLLFFQTAVSDEDKGECYGDCGGGGSEFLSFTGVIGACLKF